MLLPTVHKKFHFVKHIIHNPNITLPKHGTTENEEQKTCIKLQNLPNFKFCQKLFIKFLKHLDLEKCIIFFFNRDLNSRFLAYIFLLCFSGSKF